MAQLRILKQQMALGGLKMGTRTVDFGGGVRCFCNIYFNVEEVFVSVPSKAADISIKTVIYKGDSNPIKKSYELWGDLVENNFTHTTHYAGWGIPVFKKAGTTFDLTVDAPAPSSFVPKSRQDWQDGLGELLTWDWSGDRYNKFGACGTSIYLNGLTQVTAPGIVLGAAYRTRGGKKYILAAIKNSFIYEYDQLAKTWTKLNGRQLESFPVFFTASGNKAAYCWAPDGYSRNYRGHWININGLGSFDGAIDSTVPNQYISYTYIITLDIESYSATEIVNNFATNGSSYFGPIQTSGFPRVWDGYRWIYLSLYYTGTEYNLHGGIIAVDATEDIVYLQSVNGFYGSTGIESGCDWFSGNYTSATPIESVDTSGPLAVAKRNRITGELLVVTTSPTLSLPNVSAMPMFTHSMFTLSGAHYQTNVTTDTYINALPLLVDLRTTQVFLHSYRSSNIPTASWVRSKYLLDTELWTSSGDYDSLVDIYNSTTVSMHDPVAKFTNDPYATSYVYLHNKDSTKQRLFISVIYSATGYAGVYCDGNSVKKVPGFWNAEDINHAPIYWDATDVTQNKFFFDSLGLFKS